MNKITNQSCHQCRSNIIGYIVFVDNQPEKDSTSLYTPNLYAQVYTCVNQILYIIQTIGEGTYSKLGGY